MNENQANFTAIMVAYMRAYHAMHDTPKIFDGFLAHYLIPEDKRKQFEENLTCWGKNCLILDTLNYAPISQLHHFPVCQYSIRITLSKNGRTAFLPCKIRERDLRKSYPERSKAVCYSREHSRD